MTQLLSDATIDELAVFARQLSGSWTTLRREPGGFAGPCERDEFTVRLWLNESQGTLFGHRVLVADRRRA